MGKPPKIGKSCVISGSSVGQLASINMNCSRPPLARPGDGGIRTRRIALLIADGADADSLQRLHAQLANSGTVPRFVGPHLGRIAGIDVEVTLEAAPSVLFDAVVLPDGDAGEALSKIGLALEFVKDQYRHCKPMLALGSGQYLLEAVNIVAAIAKHRHFQRQTDPPRV